MEENKDPLIYAAIVGTMSDIGAVGKDKQNQTQGFKYRGVDDVMNALNPALTKNGVFILPEILEIERSQRKTAKGGILYYSVCKMLFTFYAKDGSSVKAITIGEGMDSGDKATNKAMAIAYKYACFQTFCIPTEEMKDPDAETPEPTIPDNNKPGNQNQDNNKSEDLNSKVDPPKIAALRSVLEKAKVSETAITKRYKINSVEELTLKQFYGAMKTLEKQCQNAK